MGQTIHLKILMNFSSKNFLVTIIYIEYVSYVIVYFSILSTIGIPNIVEMRNDLHDYNDFTVPGVELHCLFGDNIDTVER